jgi:hypothetical protein
MLKSISESRNDIRNAPACSYVMPSRVYYHHPDDRQFSLDYVNPHREDVEERVEQYGDDVDVFVEEYELDRPVYVVYTATGASGDAEEVEYDFLEEIEALDPLNRVIAARYASLFETVIRENFEEEGERVQAYKDVDVDAIDDAINQIDWNGTAVEVAGRIASNLILKHPLPNANHRTAIGLVQVYLRRVDPRFSMPDTARPLDGGDEFDWMTWVNEYIKESKRLLTVRRNGKKFYYLEQWGGEVLERTHGIEIWLEEYELDMPPSERWRTYARQHEDLWIEFVTEAVTRSELDVLCETAGLTKHEFANELQELE